MCVPVESPDGIHTIWRVVIAQLVLECVQLVLSIFTFADYGYLGAGAAILGMIGTIMVLARGCGKPEYALPALLFCNVLAFCISAGHIAAQLWLLATVSEWCCEKVSETSVTILLIVLLVIWVTGELMRIVVIIRVRALRKSVAQGTVTPATGTAVQGVPVAVAYTAPAAAP